MSKVPASTFAEKSLTIVVNDEKLSVLRQVVGGERVNSTAWIMAEINLIDFWRF
jgi:hypothetical protein